VEEALLQEKEVWRKKFSLRGEGSSDRAQDLKVLVTHLDQEDQEETKFTVNFLVII
jgi:hypothetical protein